MATWDDAVNGVKTGRWKEHGRTLEEECDVMGVSRDGRWKS